MNPLFKKIFNHRSETILGAGLITVSFALLSSVLGIVRNALLASRFGASSTLDIYYATFRLPDLIYNIFIVGTISAAFIPLLNDYLTNEREKAWQFSSLVIALVSFFLIISGLGIIIFARPLLKKILIGFSEENLQTAVLLTRIMMIQPLLLGISAVFSSILRSFRLFLITALTPVVYNAGIIFGILFLSPIFGLKGLIYGVIFGAFLHLFIQLPALLSLGYRFERFKISLFIFSLKKMFAIMFTRSLSIVLSQVFLVGITAIATLLEEGTITIFNFVDNILPYTIFALPLADAAFPYLSRLESEGKKEEFIFHYLKTLILILLFIIPFACWIIVFREPIVRFLLGYGKFGWKATVLTMEILSILSLAMIFQSLNYYLLKVFFAKKDAKRPFISSLIAYLSGLGFCFYLGTKYGPHGLAWG
ncbi:MAG: lipid II flippase MurJ, partial [Minisyncoccia bacterium]